MIRISTQMMYKQNTYNIMNENAQLMVYSNQLSSGKRVIRPSDDPMSASQSVVVTQGEAQNKQYKVARSFAETGMSQEEMILASATSTIQSIKTILIYAGNDALSDAERSDVLAMQLQGLKEQLMGLANSTDASGRFIFAGFKTDKAPFVMDATTGAVSYIGGDIPIQQKVEAERTMTVNHTGKRVFMELPGSYEPEPPGPGGVVPPSEANIFNSIDYALQSLAIPREGATQAAQDNAHGLLDKSIRGLANSLNNVLTVRSELGTQLQELDALNNMGAQITLSNTSQESNLVYADIYKATSDYSQQKLALEASMIVFKNMKGLSLFETFS